MDLPITETVQRWVSAVMVAAVATFRVEGEQSLCDRAKAGDRKALGTLLRAYGPVLYRSVLLPRLGSSAVAEDALSETYSRVIDKFSTYEWQPCGIYPWLRVIALRIALDILRSRRRESVFDPDDLERELDAVATQSDEDVEQLQARDLAEGRRRVDLALKKLNPRYERAIRLRILEERPREEVAQTLEVSVSTFDVVLHRALCALKKALTSERPEEAPRP